MNVTTIYYNSIEIEWKPGGVSDIIYYIVKYRQIGKQLNSDSFEPTDYSDVNHEMVNKETNAAELLNNDDSYFIMINTTNTKLKVGTSLRPYTYYEFKVVAVNLLGHSRDTEPIIVRTAATSKIFELFLTIGPKIYQ